MRAFPTDGRKPLRRRRVDLDPEEVQIGERPHDLPVTRDLRVEIQVEQDVHVRPGPFAQRPQMPPEIRDDLAVDVLARFERSAEARRPASRRACRVVEDVGLQRRETAFTDLRSKGRDPLDVGDRVPVVLRQPDPPGSAVRPVHRHPVSHPAAEQVAAGDAERLRPGVEHRVLDRSDAHRHDPGHRLSCPDQEPLVDPLDIPNPGADDALRELLDDRGDADRAPVLVVLAPADDAVVGRQPDEVVVPPTGVAVPGFDAPDLHPSLPSPAGTPPSHSPITSSVFSPRPGIGSSGPDGRASKRMAPVGRPTSPRVG